jgi:xanthine/uracil permease
MGHFQFKYGLDDKPPWWISFLYGLQWLAVTLPGVLIIGRVVGTFHFSQPAEQIFYLQKIFLITGASLFLQILYGHRLPLIMGPAAVLLVGIVATRGFALESVYTAIFINGILLALLSFSGLFERIRRFFTTTVVAVVLLLIAFTLTPTVLNLIVGGDATPSPLSRLLFSFCFVPAMFLIENHLRGAAKSILVVTAMAVGSLFYSFFFGTPGGPGTGSYVPWFAWPLAQFTMEFSLDWGVILSFLFCFMALAVNDLGSIQSLQGFFPLEDMDKRIRHGMALTGLSNAVSGGIGVIGSVNYSISPGLVLSTGCASRYTLLPTAGALILLSFSPAAISCIAGIPHLIIGCVLFYILANQVGAGLTVAISGRETFSFREGLAIGIPVLLGTLLSFLPQEVTADFPDFSRPIVGNGFVMGVLASLLVEHLLLRHRKNG